MATGPSAFGLSSSSLPLMFHNWPCGQQDRRRAYVRGELKAHQLIVKLVVCTHAVRSCCQALNLLLESENSVSSLLPPCNLLTAIQGLVQVYYEKERLWSARPFPLDQVMVVEEAATSCHERRLRKTGMIERVFRKSVSAFHFPLRITFYVFNRIWLVKLEFEECSRLCNCKRVQRSIGDLTSFSFPLRNDRRIAFVFLECLMLNAIELC